MYTVLPLVDNYHSTVEKFSTKVPKINYGEIKVFFRPTDSESKQFFSICKLKTFKKFNYRLLFKTPETQVILQQLGLIINNSMLNCFSIDMVLK